ncbi:MAG: hypothetical protein HPY59_14700 [Anaerolineae bacterium]|nr:hypothetical protein SY88_23150 [Clostridiales bacterium PH28_bin88]NPV77606.1 hypothetical protein [Anaerolineae bacterium]BCY16602.1 hypothetical protein hrd7_04510 [Leptolinea sp. HRD-7]
MEDQGNQQEGMKTACGGVIRNPERFPSAIYQSVRVYFCNIACLRVYEQAPDAFMRGEVEHPTEED